MSKSYKRSIILEKGAKLKTTEVIQKARNCISRNHFLLPNRVKLSI